MVKIVCDRCGKETYMKNPDLTGRAKIGFEEYDLCKYCILDIKRFINQGRADRKTENGSEFPNNCEPKTETKTETKNSNLTFEKRTMRDCYNCKRYETEGECIECHYEPKDEPQTDCAWVKGE